ncbi:MAG TPA: hypothetical protein VGS79_08830 [Puia sp.]|nr:hypothetical protein [Puia sp.]
MATIRRKTQKKAASSVKPKKQEKAYEQPEVDDRIDEPAVEYTTKIRSIGNSKGVILNNQIMDFAGLDADREIVLRALNGSITIKQAEKPVINTDLSTWDAQFKAAIEAGDIPEGDMWEGMENEFDKMEW